MAVIRTRNVDLKVNGDGAYATIPESAPCQAPWHGADSGMVGHRTSHS
jgi:hypothetical protein